MGEVIDASDLFKKKRPKSRTIYIIKILKNHHTNMITLFKDLFMASSNWKEELQILDAVDRVLAKIKKESRYTKNLMDKIISGDVKALKEGELFAEYLKNRINSNN